MADCGEEVGVNFHRLYVTRVCESIVDFVGENSYPWLVLEDVVGDTRESSGAGLCASKDDGELV